MDILSSHMNTTRWFTSILILLPLTSALAAAERTCVREEVETSQGRTPSWAPLKLDRIYLRDMETVQKGLTGINFSDHRALRVEVKC